MADPLRGRLEAALGDAYEVQAEIGRGGMGVVYRVRDRKLRRDVALKVLPPDLAFREEVRTRFLREAETAAQLNHPNIVPIYSVDDRDGLVWFVMGLVQGESLAARLARNPCPPIADVSRILQEVADALAYAHARGIIHRDIKPDNILIDALTQRPMVTDFGIARAAEGDSRLTLTGIAVGTPAYMSPEQATGEREIDGRSDLYSLAVVGYQMLSGELPFTATNTPAMLMKHINDPLRPIGTLRPDVPPALAAVVERALAKKPNERWDGAAAFRDAVAGVEHDPAPAPRTAQDAPVPWKRPAVPAPPRAPAIPTAPPNASFRDPLPRNGRSPRMPLSSRTLDAIEAASAGWQDNATPPVPSFMPESWREVRRQWRSERRRSRRSGRGERAETSGEQLSADSREEAIRSFRRRLARSAVLVGTLAGINVIFTPFFPWFLFPTAAMSLGILQRGAALWGDGVRFSDVFGRKATDNLRRGASSTALASPRLSINEQAARLATPDVIAGPYGQTVRRAAADRAAALDALERLAPADRALIPDVEPTVNALAERVASLAGALHRLDEDVTQEMLDRLDRRIADTKAQPEAPERDQRLALLERQRVTMTELLGRRDTLTAQLESASLLLQNMRLDLLALKSAGIQSIASDVTSATQEARALSRDIQIALEAAKEVR